MFIPCGKKRRRGFRFLLFALVCCLLFTACAAEIPDSPGEDAADPDEGGALSVWDCTLDDLGNYLAQCGDIRNDDYVRIGGISSEARNFWGIEIYWWDVENLDENSAEYETWAEYEANEFYYVMYGTMVLALTNNGPFGMNILDSYTGDRDVLKEDFLAFPSGYSYAEVTTAAETEYSRDRAAVYKDYDSLIASYPDDTYAYETDPVDLPSSYCIRDDWMLYTKQQFADTCWAEAGLTALSTALMKGKGEYFELSEGWISLTLAAEVKAGNLPSYTNCIGDEYIYGDGSGMLGIDFAKDAAGLMLESDFGGEEAFAFSQENLDEAYGYYSAFADTALADEVSMVHFYNYAIRNRSSVIKNSIRRHILEYGSVITWTSTANWTEKEINGETVTVKDPTAYGTSDHVVSIIGWDDDFAMTFGSATYKGAWIVLNSWGQDENKDGGVLYIFYNDSCYTNGDTDFFGYRYTGGEDAAFSDTVLESNASYETSLCGAYAGDFSAETNATKQKNVFYGQEDIEITYAYEAADGTGIEEISVRYGAEDVTDLFTVAEDPEARTVSLSGEDLPHGVYKVLTTWSDGETEGTYTNALYLCDGTEVNYIRLMTETENAVENNPVFYDFYDFGNGDGELMYYTDRDTGTLVFNITSACYSAVSGWETDESAVTFSERSDFCEYVTVVYDLAEKSEYGFSMRSETGAEKRFTVRVEKTEETFLTRVFTDTEGAASESRLLPVGEDGAWLEGPEELSLYYGRDFSEALTGDGNGNWLVEYERILRTDSATSAFADSYAAYSATQVIFLYAGRG